MRRSMHLMTVAALVAAVSVTALPAAPAAALDVACATIVQDGVCTMTLADYPNGAEFSIPDGIDAITVLVAGAMGGDEDGKAAAGGAGGLLIDTIDLDASGRDFSVVLGDDGNDTSTGYTAGGDGGAAGLIGSHGGHGGGSTALLNASGDPLLVAGGGGGGGGNINTNPDKYDPSGGGLGGQSGQFHDDGRDGDTPKAGDGNGGASGGAPTGDGQDGEGYVPPQYQLQTGGGGGGGGWPNGGGGGGAGSESACNLHGCPPDAQPGGGGGGGAGVSGWDPSMSPYPLVAPRGDGWVQIYLGAAQELDCQATNEGQTWTVPADTGAVGVVAVGGQGWRDHNDEDSQGVGGMVTGLLDTAGIAQLTYWVGCSALNGGWGFGSPGSGAAGRSADSNHGGAGGGQTAIVNGDNNQGDVWVAAGGGGGTGGNAICIGELGCKYDGGWGGSSGGTDSTMMVYDGRDGEATFTDPSGGCGGCESDLDGGDGESSDGGGGGGGGAGFPYGGHGGHAISGLGAAGGGGGAGSSYAGQRMSDVYIGASGWQNDGFLLLIPVPEMLTSLNVAKAVTGDGAAYGTGQFDVNLECTLGGVVVTSGQFSVLPGYPQLFERIPVGASCTATEFANGGATEPAPPQTLVLAPGPNTITLTNVFDTADLTVSLTSATDPPDSGTTFGLGQLSVNVQCVFNGQTIVLGAPVVNGSIAFTGEDTWDGASVEVPVPVGAVCSVQQAPPPGAPTVTYPDGSSATVGADGATVGILDTYRLVDVPVTKVLSGDGTKPTGPFTIGISCTFGGTAVTLATDELSLDPDANGSFPEVPVGADCSLTEPDSRGAVTTTYAPNRVFRVVDDQPLTTVTNQFEDDQLWIMVETTGTGASWANADYQVHLTCTLADTTIVDELYTVGPAGTEFPVDVDAGAACTISEDATGGATAVLYPRGTNVVMPADGGPAALEVENRFDLAPVRVESQNVGDGSAYANVPTVVTVDECTFNGQAHAYSNPIGFGVHGGNTVFDEIVVGADCRFVQTTGNGGFPTYDVNDGEPVTELDPGVRATISASGPTWVTVFNNFLLGAVAVNKTVTGDAAYAANTPYVVAVHCTFNELPVAAVGPDGIGELTFEADGTPRSGPTAAALAALPQGAECTASETVTGGATVSYAPEGDGESAPVAVPGTITITNTFAATSLQVGKEVEGNDAAAHLGDTFWFDVHCTFNDKTLNPIPGNVGLTFGLKDGETRTIQPLPVGADCTTVEVDDRNATSVEPGTSQAVILGADDEVVGFTNTFDVNELIVRQVVTGAGAATYGEDRSYYAKLFCRYPDGAVYVFPGTATFELSPSNGFEQVVTVPVGVTCRISEDNTYHATALTSSPPVTVELGDSPELESTARFDLATIAVSTIAHGQFPASTEFGYETLCVWPESDPVEQLPTNEPEQQAFQLRSGQSLDVQALMGSLCSVTETDTAGALRVVVAATGPGTRVFPDGADALLVPPGEIAFSFENFMTGSLPVTGAEWRGLGLIAGALLLVGVGVLVTRRIRTLRA